MTTIPELPAGWKIRKQAGRHCYTNKYGRSSRSFEFEVTDENGRCLWVDDTKALAIEGAFRVAAERAAYEASK